MPQKPISFSSDEIAALTGITAPSAPTPAVATPQPSTTDPSERVMRPGMLPHIGALASHILGGIFSAEGGPTGALISGGSDALAQKLDSASPINLGELTAETGLGFIPLGKVIGEAKPAVSAGKQFLTNAGRMAAYTEATNAIRRAANTGNIKNLLPQSKEEWLGDLLTSLTGGIGGGVGGAIAGKANTFNKVNQRLAQESEASAEGQLVKQIANENAPTEQPKLVQLTKGRKSGSPVATQESPVTSGVIKVANPEQIGTRGPGPRLGHFTQEDVVPEPPGQATERKLLQQQPTAVKAEDVDLNGVTSNPDLIHQSLDEAQERAAEEAAIARKANEKDRETEKQLLNKEQTADRQATAATMGGTDLGTIIAKTEKAHAKAAVDAEKAAQLEAAKKLRDQLLESGDLEASTPSLTETSARIPTASGSQTVRQTFRPPVPETPEAPVGPDTAPPSTPRVSNGMGEFEIPQTDPQKVASIKFNTYDQAVHAMAGSGKVGKIVNDGKGAWFVRYPDIAPLTPAELLQNNIQSSVDTVVPHPPEAPEAFPTAGQEPTGRDLLAQAAGLPKKLRDQIDVSGEPLPSRSNEFAGMSGPEAIESALADLKSYFNPEGASTPVEPTIEPGNGAVPPTTPEAPVGAPKAVPEASTAFTTAAPAKSIPDLISDYRNDWDAYYNLKNSKAPKEQIRAAADKAGATQTLLGTALKDARRAGQTLPQDLLDQNKVNPKLYTEKAPKIPANPDSDQLIAMPPDQQTQVLNTLVNKALNKAKGEKGAIDPKLATQISMHIAGAIAGSLGGRLLSTPEHRQRDEFIGALVGGLAPMLRTPAGARMLAQWRAQGLLTNWTTIAKKVLGDNAAVLSEAWEGGIAKKDPVYAAKILKNFYNTNTAKKFVDSFKATAGADAMAERYASVPVMRKGPLAWPSRALGAATEATLDSLMRAGLPYDKARDLVYLGTPKTPFLATMASIPSKGVTGRILMPFARIATNLFEKGVNRTPIGAIARSMNPANTGSSEAMRRLAVEGLTGTGVGALGYALGPKEGEKQSPVNEALKVAAAGPYGLPLAAGMALRAAANSAHPNYGTIARKATQDVMQQLPIPANINPVELIRTLMIPRIAAEAAKRTDPAEARKTNEDFFDPIAADIPGFRTNLPEKNVTPEEERILRAYAQALRNAGK